MTIKLDCSHADTCLVDYWSGHHLPHVQIAVWPGMTLAQIKRELHNELSQGAVAGNEPLTLDDSGPAGDAWYKRAHAAVNRLAPATKGQRSFFRDIEAGDDCETVYAFFLFVEA
jgi:hypothetical protein